jgi:hypothetical protein
VLALGELLELPRQCRLRTLVGAAAGGNLAVPDLDIAAARQARHRVAEGGQPLERGRAGVAPERVLRRANMTG